MTLLFIAFGSNQENPARQLRMARQTLAAHPHFQEKAASGIYRTPPWGYAAQPDFYNAAAAYESDLSAETVLHVLQTIEQAQHRVRGMKNGPRTLDLDLLLYGDAKIETPALTVPHPRLHERAFVLAPLADIDAELAIAGQGKVRELLAACDTSGQHKLCGADWAIR